MGVVPGRDRSLPPVLLGAHYDSVIDAPCVDDNATSVALNLAIAEEYVLRPLERDLVACRGAHSILPSPSASTQNFDQVSSPS